MPGILKHKITFDCETSQLHSGTIICPSRQSGRLGLLLLALLAFWRHNGIIDIAPYYPATRNFPTSLRACVNNRRKFPSVEYKAGPQFAYVLTQQGEFLRVYTRVRGCREFFAVCARACAKNIRPFRWRLPGAVNMKLGRICFEVVYRV